MVAGEADCWKTIAGSAGIRRQQAVKGRPTDHSAGSVAESRGGDLRRAEERTLTNLYNARPTWLDLAHRHLDAAICDAYGWPHDIADEEILERLLALNLARAEAGSGSSAE